MKRLEGRTALVTGAARGIGKAIALELAREGAAVAINDYMSEAATCAVADEINQAGGRAIAVQANVADPAESRNLVKHVAEQFGHLDILVNNAGITRDKSLRKLTDDDWDKVIATDLSSVYYCLSAAVPVMISQNFGRIINISSFVAQAGNFGQANYAAAKAGILGLTKTAAIELVKYNITVNAIAPGFTRTEMVAAIPAAIQEQIKTRIPMGRFAEPEEIARGVVYLAADGAYITGQTLGINGGMYM